VGKENVEVGAGGIVRLVSQKPKQKREQWLAPCFYRYLPTGEIYFQKTFRKEGFKKLHFPTGEKTIGRARAKAELELTRYKNRCLGIDDTHVFGKKKIRTVSSVVDEILKHHTPTLRATTQAKHRIYLTELSELLDGVDIEAVTTERFTELLRRLKRSRKRQTFMDYAKYMNLIVRYAYNKRYVSHLIRFKNPDKGKVHEDRVYTDDELSRVWDAMRGRTRDQFVLSNECFMRLREVLYLTWERVDLETGKITLRAVDVKTGSRTGKGREFIASKYAIERLRARYAERQKRGITSPYVFPSKSDPRKPQHDNKTAWRLAKKAAGITGRATWHSIRHTAITKALLVKRVSPILVSQYAGVSLQIIERTYLHSKAQDTARAARGGWGDFSPIRENATEARPTKEKPEN
jgi:integrase